MEPPCGDVTELCDGTGSHILAVPSTMEPILRALIREEFQQERGHLLTGFGELLADAKLQAPFIFDDGSPQLTLDTHGTTHATLPRNTSSHSASNGKCEAPPVAVVASSLSLMAQLELERASDNVPEYKINLERFSDSTHKNNLENGQCEAPQIATAALAPSSNTFAESCKNELTDITKKCSEMVSADIRDSICSRPQFKMMKQQEWMQYIPVAITGESPYIPSVKLLIRIVDSQYFETASMMLIVMNVMMLAVEMQYVGFQVGYELGVPLYDKHAKDIWSHAYSIFEVCDAVFNVGFVIELVLRISARCPSALACRWIQLDFVLVGASLLEVIGVISHINPSMLRMVRFLRILRMFRLIRDMGVAEALFSFLKAIEECIGALFWAFIVLAFIEVAVGMVIHQILTFFITDTSNDMLARQRVFAYFGSFTKTMITMFEITLGNWVVVCRLLMKDVSEWYGLFFVFYRCMFIFGAVKVITAVFIAQTNRAMAKDDDMVVMLQEQERTAFRMKLEEMFNALDTSRDGYLSWTEFQVITTSPHWRAWGDRLGLPMSDLANLFELLAGDDDSVSASEFFQGVQRLRGGAKAIDMVWLLSEVGKMIERLDRPIVAVVQDTILLPERAGSRVEI